MSKMKNKKRFISAFIIMVLLMGGIYITPKRVECEGAYHECMSFYGGYLPAPYGTFGSFYCRNGYLFCVIFMR